MLETGAIGEEPTERGVEAVRAVLTKVREDDEVGKLL